jgi:Skp family chaperone for outer membrane proteins
MYMYSMYFGFIILSFILGMILSSTVAKRKRLLSSNDSRSSGEKEAEEIIRKAKDSAEKEIRQLKEEFEKEMQNKRKELEDLEKRLNKNKNQT